MQCTQTLTARTAWYVEGNSKATPPPHSIALEQAQRAGRERRDGRRRQGSKPHGRDSVRGAGGAREPDGAMRRDAPLVASVVCYCVLGHRIFLLPFPRQVEWVFETRGDEAKGNSNDAIADR
jgi:hypothetical protein